MPTPNLDVLVLRVVSSVELFRHLEREDLNALLSTASKSVFKAGETVFEEGDKGSSMYVVITGQFDVCRNHQGHKMLIASIKPGEHFGEVALISERPRSATIVSKVQGVALRLTKEAIFGNPRVAVHLLRNMSRILAARLTSSDDEVLFHRLKEQQAEAEKQAEQERPVPKVQPMSRRTPPRRFTG